MTERLILASASAARAMLLTNAALKFSAIPAKVDEHMMKKALLADAAAPRDIADTLAEMKARRVSDGYPDSLVLGCDQILEFDGQILNKPQTTEDAIGQLKLMRGKNHDLLSAAVICADGAPIWRHVGVVHMEMRKLSDDFLEAYVSRNWTSIRETVGAYRLEEEGVRLFSRIKGDYFSVLGLPLLEVLSFLAVRGEIET